MSIYTAPYQESGSSLAYTAPVVPTHGSSLMERYLENSNPYAVHSCIHCRLVNGFRVLVRVAMHWLG